MDLPQYSFETTRATLWKGLAIGAIMAALILLALTLRRKDDVVVDGGQDKRMLDSLAVKVRILTNRNGELFADNKALVEKSQERIKAASDSIFHLKEKDRERIRQINALTKLQGAVTTRGEFIPFIPQSTAAKSDSIAVPRSFAGVYGNRVYNGRVLKDGVMIDSADLKFNIYLQHVTRSYGPLNMRTEHAVQAISPDSGTVINGLSTITFKEKPKRFGAGPYVGFGYNGQKWIPSAGVSVHFNLIRF